MAEIGYQLSSITPYLDTEEHIRSSLSRIAEIGYHFVQLQGVPKEVPDKVIASALQNAGLDCVATQEDYPFGFGEDPDRFIERAVTCGAEYLTMALIPWEVDNAEKLEKFAEGLLPICKKVKNAGLIFAFHPIGPDFRLMDGVPVYQRLLAHLPEEVQLTFCVQASFNHVPYTDVLKKHGSRIDLVHFKDGVILPKGEIQLTPLGEGEHDWQPILTACEGAGVKYIFAEQERWDRDAFDCAAASLSYLKGLHWIGE